MCCSEGIFVVAPGVNVVGGGSVGTSMLFVLIGCCCEAVPLDAFTRLGSSLLVIEFVKCSGLDRVFPGRDCQERAGAVPR